MTDASVSTFADTKTDAVFDPEEQRQRDLRAIERAFRVFEGAADTIEEEIALLKLFHADRVTTDDTQKETASFAEKVGRLYKSLQSVMEVQERLAKKAEGLAGAEGGLDFDAARAEVERRLAGLAERMREVEVS